MKYGYYEMTRYFKFMNSMDTSKSNSTCYFKKLKTDDLNLPAFRYDNGDISLYTGNELVEAQSWDSTAIIFSKNSWSKKIEKESYRFNFFLPLTNEKYPIVQHDSDFSTKSNFFKLVGEENLKNDTCYHIQVNALYNDDISENLRTIKIEYNYWIKKSDFLPIQYSIVYTNVLKNDTTFQYEKNVLTKYDLNIFNDKNVFSLTSIPQFYKLRDYIPTNSSLLLPNDTIAPNWELLSIKNKKINLHGLKGKIVLLDFFTKSCYPCMLALPGLETLHEKYKKKGLKVIGIDIFDKKEDGIVTFLLKHNITYTILLGGKDVGISYNVSGIPTVYLIDKNGKIIFSIVGYEKGQEKKLERLIELNL